MAADHDWPMVKLGDLGRFASGGTPNRKREEFYQGETPWISSADISEDGKITARRFITDEAIAKSATTEVPAGTLLVAVRIGVGKTAITTSPTCFSQDVVALLDTDPNEVSTGFLQHLITWLRPHLEQIARGVTIKGITIGDLKDLNIPLPPLAEQRRIAKILDTVNIQIHRTKEASNYLKDELARAFFQQLGRNSQPAQIKTLATVTTGSTPSRKHPEYYGGSIPWVKTNEVSGTAITSTEETITETGLENSSCKINPPGTVLVAMYGQGRTRGSAGILRIPATTNQACAAISCTNPADSDYVYFALKASYEELRSLGRGGTQPNLNLGLIRGFSIPYPPAEQREELTITIKKMENLNHAYETQLQKLEELNASLSARAFAGKL
ncbi:restriction endonuclease subunit S [Corynebacterium urealyticum]|uniref:Type I restriction-modification system, specificity subunit n=1 Tax=Corynebacterium urealyticum (strain ATCC 43042 / DSM 7109) TaxID=504474 RepID=B1VEN9_CORU7|nr:restriction endonuclease subunit S [Corynebacterium urealyticum]QQC42245.1 restriction endonuclease subunit S [Corynebacterium urealyticum]CAQ04228.1 type I restriction-modification system, specificity subunit [Corynebacterium urealyticum DSM 7109]SNV94165.1 type I restriction-modification system, specificity subunit [Corynebacterium urealyticum]